MLTVELHTRDIPAIYARFASEIGERNWKQRVATLKSDIRGNPFLRDLHGDQYSIAFQLERLREMQERFGGVSVEAYNDESTHPAASFAAQVLSVIDASSTTLAERFRSRVRGALKNPDDMRGLRLELATATHFLRAGKRVVWPEMASDAAPRGRSFDLLIEDFGPRGLELECKSFSDEKGRRISRRQAMDFFWHIRKRHWDRLKRVSSGIVAVVTVPQALPSDHRTRQAIADNVARHIIHSPPGLYEFEGASLRLREVDPAAAQAIAQSVHSGIDSRRFFDQITETRNKEVLAMGCEEGGGAIVLAVQSAEDDAMMDGIVQTLKAAASGQLSGQRAGIMVAGLDGLTGEQLFDVAMDEHRGGSPNELQIRASEFLSSENRDHVVGLAFLSASAMRPTLGNVQDSGGTAYYFPKRQSLFWDDAFSGLFGTDPRPSVIS